MESKIRTKLKKRLKKIRLKKQQPKAAFEADNNLGLTLTGGGSRGAYQMGVWKALRDLNLDHNISFVCGTSVGAINAAIIVQNDFEKAFSIWKELEYKNIFRDYDEIIKKNRIYRKPILLVRKLITEGGLNVAPLKKLLREHLDEERIRKSPIGFGLVVYDLRERKAIHLTKDQIPEGRLVDYIIASATFPLFQAHQINNKKFLDGGIGDNRPLQFLLQEKNIDYGIVIDVTVARYFWPKKSKNQLKYLDYVYPSKFLGSPLSFDNKRIRKNMAMGYQDAIKFYYIDNKAKVLCR